MSYDGHERIEIAHFNEDDAAETMDALLVGELGDDLFWSTERNFGYGKSHPTRLKDLKLLAKLPLRADIEDSFDCEVDPDWELFFLMPEDVASAQAALDAFLENEEEAVRTIQHRAGSDELDVLAGLQAEEPEFEAEGDDERLVQLLVAVRNALREAESEGRGVFLFRTEASAYG